MVQRLQPSLWANIKKNSVALVSQIIAFSAAVTRKCAILTDWIISSRPTVVIPTFCLPLSAERSPR